MTLHAGVIPAKAGTQYTLQQGAALNEVLCRQDAHASIGTPFEGDLGARLRGHDARGRAALRIWDDPL
jgi:hypothetical protein